MGSTGNAACSHGLKPCPQDAEFKPETARPPRQSRSAVQSIARNDSNNQLTKRHLYNISKLKPDKQKQIANKVQQDKLTAKQTEELINTDSSKVTVKKFGMASRQRRFKTAKADVVFTFRRKPITDEDIRDVLVELGNLIV